MVLEFSNVAKTYDKTNFSIKNISFKLKQGEILGLVGQNGSGKSTLLKIANQLINQDQGKIIFEGQDLNDFNNKELNEYRRKVAYIFQNSNLLDNKTVLYHLNLVYKLSNKKVDKTEIDEVLEFLGLEKYKNSYTRSLSGGQKQKVAIAMALLQKPRVLLCDEISSALDSKAEKEIYDLLLDIVKKQGISIIMISHNLNIIKSLCDRILILEDGSIKDDLINNKTSYRLDSNYYDYIREYLNA